MELNTPITKEVDTNYPNGMDASLSCIITDAILSILFATKSIRDTQTSQHDVFVNAVQSLEFAVGTYYHSIEARKPFPQQKYFLFQVSELLEIIVNVKNMIHNFNLENQKNIIWFSILSLSFYLIKYHNNIDFTQNYTNTSAPSIKFDMLVYAVYLLNQLTSVMVKNNEEKLKYVILFINGVIYLSGNYKLIGNESFNHNAIWHTGIIIANLLF